MKGSTWGWIVGAVVIVIVVAGVWWKMHPQMSDVSYGTATSTDALASNNLPPTKSVSATTASGSIMTTLAKLPDTSRFAALLSSSGVAAQLAGKGPYTLFVPINEAFAFQQPGALNLTAVQLKRLVQYHVISGKSVDVNAQVAGMMQALSKDMLNFNVRTGDKSARINSSVALQRYTTSNGTIYLIDQVLIPPQTAQQ